MARGVDGRSIFIDDLDRRDLLGTVLGLKPETDLSILAYCLMGNHFHFALKVGNTPLSQIMQRLLTAYVIGFNARHAREGHLFQARYKAFLCHNDAYLIALVRYIHMNPVRAGLAANPGDWPWSSHRQYARRTRSPLADSRLFFDAAGPDAREYEQWATDADKDFKPWPEAGTSAPLFREEAVERPSLDALASDLFPDDLDALKSGSRLRAISAKKYVIAQRALRSGLSLASVAAWMGCSTPAVHQLLRRNTLITLRPDPDVSTV